MKYVLLFVETEQYAKDLEAMDPADRDRAFMLVGQWFMENADKVKGGSKLRAPDTATTVRRSDDGDHVVLDGPFVEGKEVVSGYTEVEADKPCSSNGSAGASRRPRQRPRRGTRATGA